MVTLRTLSRELVDAINDNIDMKGKIDYQYINEEHQALQYALRIKKLKKIV